MKKSITIMIPAYNEEEHLKNAVISTEKILKNFFTEYEILIFNDCSTDRTGKIADKLAEDSPKTRVIHNRENKGMGYNYRVGIKLAKMEYYGWVPGDDEIESSSIENMMRKVGNADILIAYTANARNRALARKIVSITFTKTLNLLFGLSLRYYNGISVHKTKLLKGIKMTTNSFAYHAEILVRLISKGCTYEEVPQYIKKTHESRMLFMKNLLEIINLIIRLFYEVRIKSVFGADKK